MRVAIQTLGCKVNQSESASIERTLRNNNYEIVKYTDNPDVCIVNTCTVTAKSDYQSRQLIRKAVKSGARVIATGCYAQLRSDELSKIEGLNLVIGNSEKDKIQEYIYKLSSFRTNIFVNPPDAPLTSQPYYSSRSRAFLKIQDGCNFSCSYCTIPLARGKSRSLNQQDVLTSINKLSSDGYKEIVLTGIHIGSYGVDLQPEGSLLEIVDKITKSYTEIRFRLSSIEPQEFKMEFLSYIKRGTVCSHLHIPLQSGSDKILKAMNRGYTSNYFKQLINNIVAICPDISIGTDLIAGFPGETDKDFDDTVKFVDQLPLSYIHVFPYSKRPNTKASLLKHEPNSKKLRDRVGCLLKISKIKKLNYITRNLGQKLNVIVENKSTTNDYYSAISDNYLRIFIQSNNINPGQRLNVKVTSLSDIGLISQPLK